MNVRGSLNAINVRFNLNAYNEFTMLRLRSSNKLDMHLTAVSAIVFASVG